MKYIYSSLLLFLLPSICFSQKFQQEFDKLFEKKDTAGQKLLLAKWEAQKPNDAELYISYFNYYAFTSKTSGIELSNDAGNGEAYRIMDSADNTVGYLTQGTHYDTDVLQYGFDMINKGIGLHPKRLDMRFGKVYLYGEIHDYQQFTNTIIEAIEYDDTINHDWLWKEGAQLKDSKNFFLSTIQSYVSQLYNTEDDGLLPNIRQISETVLKYNPTHVESLSNIALTHIVTGELNNGLTYLLKAEKINPKDGIILGNIAEVYKRKNDKANAKLYYEKLLKTGNEDEVAYAKEQLEQLK